MSGDKLGPFFERSETQEKMGAERPGVLVPENMANLNISVTDEDEVCQELYAPRQSLFLQMVNFFFVDQRNQYSTDESSFSILTTLATAFKTNIKSEKNVKSRRC